MAIPPEVPQPTESSDEKEKDPFELALTRYGNALFSETYDSDILFRAFRRVVDAITITDTPDKYPGQKREKRKITALMAQFGSIRSRGAGDIEQSVKFTEIQERFDYLVSENNGSE